jgi:Fe-S-cluster containining protein
MKPKDEAIPANNEEIIKSFESTYFILDDNINKIFRSTVDLYTIMDILVDKKIIKKNEFDKRTKKFEKQLLDDYRKSGFGILLHDQALADKYKIPEMPEIDCAGKIHLCKAACCSFTYCLTIQDIYEGVRWNLSKPFTSVRGEDGYCIYFNKQNEMKCSMYDKRSLSCRQFDCRNDQRIWVDFDKNIINPNLCSELGLQETIETTEPAEPTAPTGPTNE